MSARGGLLVVHAHPDDETLATGGLLATWAAAGRPVTVVTCTRGELGEVIGAELAHLEGDGPALAAHREGELAAALAALRVPDHLFLDTVEESGGPEVRYTDSGMAWAGTGLAGRLDALPDGAFVAVPLDDAARRLARVLRERRPEVVATYEPGGGYGHPDHVRAHEVTMRALELASDPAAGLGNTPPHRPAAVLWAVVAAGALRGAYAELASLPAVAALLDADPALTLPDPAGPLPSLAVPDAGGQAVDQAVERVVDLAGDLTVDVAVDVTGVLDRVAAALAAHGTQVRSIAVDPDRLAGAARRPADPRPVVVGCYALSNDVLAPLLSRESYHRVPAGAPGAVKTAGDAADVASPDVAWPHVAWPAAVRPVA